MTTLAPRAVAVPVERDLDAVLMLVAETRTAIRLAAHESEDRASRESLLDLATRLDDDAPSLRSVLARRAERRRS